MKSFSKKNLKICIYKEESHEKLTSNDWVMEVNFFYLVYLTNRLNPFIRLKQFILIAKLLYKENLKYFKSKNIK